MNIAEKLTTIAENEQKVYDAGKKAEWDEFWDAFQTRGARTYYAYSFFGGTWDDVTFKPKYNFIIKGDASQVFYSCAITNLKSILEERGLTIDILQATSMYRMFAYSKITHIPPLTMPSISSLNQVFHTCSQLKEIDELVIAEANGFTNTFTGCTNLEKLIVSGTIAKNGFDVSPCKNLSVESLRSIVNALKDYSEDTSGTTWKVTLGTTNLSKLTDTEKAIATEKGWSLV